MQKAKIVLGKDGICNYLEVEFPTPHSANYYCVKYRERLPNESFAFMYCCQVNCFRTLQRYYCIKKLSS